MEWNVNHSTFTLGGSNLNTVIEASAQAKYHHHSFGLDYDAKS